MTDQITLTGLTNYNTSYPPRDARKGYVARITGRAGGGKKYEREFLGDSAELLEGDEGLYERQRGDKKGGYTRWYHVMLSHPEHGLILSTDCGDEAPKIAKLLDDGLSIEEIVEVDNLRPSEKHEGRMIFDGVVRTKAQARKAGRAQTIETAVEGCWQAMSNLPEKEQKKVLTALRKRIADNNPNN